MHTYTHMHTHVHVRAPPNQSDLEVRSTHDVLLEGDNFAFGQVYLYVLLPLLSVCGWCAADDIRVICVVRIYAYVSPVVIAPPHCRSWK